MKNALTLTNAGPVKLATLVIAFFAAMVTITILAQ